MFVFVMVAGAGFEPQTTFGLPEARRATRLLHPGITSCLTLLLQSSELIVGPILKNAAHLTIYNLRP